MATNAIHTLKIGSTEYPIYGEGFKIDTLGSLSEGDFYPILLSDKWTRAQATPTAADDSKALVTKTVGDLSWHPFGRCLYVKNLQMGGIPESGNPGGTLRLYGYIDAVEEDGYGMSLGESNQVLASGGADNNVHWRTIDLVGGKDTIGLVKNGSSVNPDGDTWKPVAFKDGVPYYQEVKLDIDIPDADDILAELRSSIFSEGPGITISDQEESDAKLISVNVASSTERGGFKTGYQKTGNNYPVQLSNETAYVNVPKGYEFIGLREGEDYPYITINRERDALNYIRGYTADIVFGNNLIVEYEGGSTNTSDSETITISSTDEKVTSVDNHYTPSENADSTLSAAGGNMVDITNNPTSIVTGIKRDSKGHVVGLETTQLKSTAAEISVDNLDMSAYLKKDEAENTYLGKNGTAAYATELTNKPSLNKSGTNQITVTAGNKTSNGFTVPYATKAAQDVEGNTISSTYLKKTGGTVKGTINIEADGVTIVSNSTIESVGFRASNLVEIGETNIIDSPNAFYIGDKDSNGGEHVIFGVDGNGVTTTEVHAANINANNITADTIVAKEIIGPDGTYLTKDEADIKYVTLADKQTITGKKTFTNTLTADDIYLESIDTDKNFDSGIRIHKNIGLVIGSADNTLKYHHLVGCSDDTARASFAGGAAVFNYADKSSHLKTVYVDNLLQTGKLESVTGMQQSVGSGSKFTFKTGESTPLEINAASATFSVPVMSSMGFFDTSDERKKNFIRPIDVDLEKLSTLKKHYFTWKDGNGEMQIGTSAQEVKELYPELVNEAEDGTLTVAYNKLSVVALAAIDKLHNENTELKKKVKTLEERLAKIESLLEENLNNL